MFNVRTDETNLTDEQEGIYKTISYKDKGVKGKLIFSRVRQLDGSMGVSLKFVETIKKSNKRRRKRK